MGTNIWKFSSAALQALEAVGVNTLQARQLLVQRLMNEGALGKAKAELSFLGVPLVVRRQKHGYRVSTSGEKARSGR